MNGAIRYYLWKLFQLRCSFREELDCKKRGWAFQIIWCYGEELKHEVTYNWTERLYFLCYTLYSESGY